jgi:hypothetical protein
MTKLKKASKNNQPEKVTNLKDASDPVNRKELFWIKGNREELQVYRVPTKLLYFNIENGRYADKMVQLRQDNPGVEIDPRVDKWKEKIWKMLSGEYPGTQRDIEPFKNLREDLLTRQQLRPGVALFDGGVLDGNRRLAVLLDLQRSEGNSTRFEYLDAVILDEDVSAEDRWRIEAGVQIGRDEKHPYSAINELLKIREGLNLFKGKPNPQKEISKVLYGISEEEIRRDIQKILLIDEYLAFIGKSQAYNEVGDVIERFEETVRTLEQAKKLGSTPPAIKEIKLTHFAIIRDKLMDNWQLRMIGTAMGAGKGSKGKNEPAIKGLLKIGSTPQLKQALSKKEPNSSLKTEFQEKVEIFLDRMDAQEKADKPLQLANNANTHLKQLLETLQEGKVTNNADSIAKLGTLPIVLGEIVKIAQECLEKAKALSAKLRAAGTGKKSQAKK